MAKRKDVRDQEKMELFRVATEYVPRIFEEMTETYARMDKMLRSLAVLNGAGAIAMLAFISALMSVKLPAKPALLPLTLFVIGVLVPLISIMFSTLRQHRELIARMKTFIEVAWRRAPPSDLEAKFSIVPPIHTPLLIAAATSLVFFMLGLAIGYAQLASLMENASPS